MAVTLIEAAKQATNEVQQAVIETFAMSTDLLAVLPFQEIPGRSLTYNQEETLPGVAFRSVNGSYPESTGIVNPIVEQLVIAGGDMDVDKFIDKTMGAGHRSVQEALKIKASGHEISHKFIKGDSASNANEFDGLQTRLTGAQVIDNGAGSGGTALSLSKLDELIDAVDDPTHLFMSKAMRRWLTAAARNSGVGGYITYDVDAFGRRIAMYGDLPILIADGNGDVNASLGFNEAAASGGATATSIYAMSLGDGMLTGIQNGGIDVQDLGELQEKPTLRTRVEWYMALAAWHPRAAGRLRYISNAAVTA
jgi:hypothetical protein